MLNKTMSTSAGRSVFATHHPLRLCSLEYAMIAQHFPGARAKPDRGFSTRLEHLGSGPGLTCVFAQRAEAGYQKQKSYGISLLQDVTGDADASVQYAPRQARMRGTVI